MKIGFNSDEALVRSVFFTKIFYIFFAEFVYSHLTRLGDTPKYLSSSIEFSPHVFLSSTGLMKTTGGVFGMLPSPIYHLPLCLLSFYGVFYLYKKLVECGLINTRKDRVYYYLLFSLPSVGVWTSIHSKESVGIFFSSICSVFICKLIFSNRLRYSFFDWMLLITSLYLMIIFKPQYVIAFFNISVFLICRKVFGARVLLFILICAVIIQVVLLDYLQPIIDWYAIQMYAHFDSDIAQSTRENIFLTEGDFYRNIIPGIFIAFIGPTVNESIASPIKFMAFLESCFIVLILSPVLMIHFKKMIILRINVLYLSIAVLFVFWILFMHYPFGIFNPGSAIRYRNNFMPFFVASLFVIKNFRFVERLVR